jgi:hypothetical protein
MSSIGSNRSRRSFLQALAVGAGSYQFGDPARGILAALGGRAAHAAPGAPPRRVVFITHPNGVHENNRWASWAAAGASETEFGFSGMTTPLERHKGEVVIFDALQLFPTIDGCQHGQGYVALWTANHWKLERDYRPKGAWGSIDQYLGSKIGKMATPKMPSIFLGAHSHSGSGGATFGMDGGYIAPVNSPYDGYAKLFADFMPATGGAAPELDPAVKLRLAMRKSVLDGVAKDVLAFQKRLGADDRSRADAQLASLRTLEDRLATNAGARTAACGKPTQGQGLNLNDGKSHPEICKMHVDLIVSAFACDVTRIVHLNLGGQTKPQSYVPGATTDCHDLSHNHRDAFVEMKKVWFGHVASFVDKLKAIPEPGPGGAPGTMLDNTLIVIGSEIGAGHTHRAIPFLTIGGKNLGVRTGRYLKFGRKAIVSYPKYLPSGVIDDGGEPHNRLLTSVLNAMGLPDKSFGASVPEFETGPLPGFLAG